LSLAREATTLEVIATVAGLPADQAGVQPGDVIVSIDGNALAADVSPRTVQQVMAHAGSPVHLEIFRGAKLHEFTLVPAISAALDRRTPQDSSAYPSPDPDWDVRATRGRHRTIEFTTDEATMEALDISPDGAWIVFDLLGHIYRVS